MWLHFMREHEAKTIPYDCPCRVALGVSRLVFTLTCAQGRAFITTSAGEKWIVYKEEETNRPYFVHAGVGKEVWGAGRLFSRQARDFRRGGDKAIIHKTRV